MVETHAVPRHQSAESPRAILVVGMHRSGTSATTRVLNLLGADLGARLMPPAQDNPAGFWEHVEVYAINERLLAALGRSWDDVRDLPAGWCDSAAAARAEAEIVRFVRMEFATAPLWAVKDPRLCRLAPIWLRALAGCGTPAGIVYVIRHPHEIAASLDARNGGARARWLLLWTQYVLEAEQATRAYPRAMLTFDELLDDWAGSMARIARGLGVLWPRAIDEARPEIEAFLDVAQRHHHSVRA